MNGCFHPVLRPMLACPAVIALIMPTAFAEDEAAVLKRFEGSWTVTQLVEDGAVIPPERIPEVLPSGGHLEIVDNALLFVDSRTGERHSRTLRINPNCSPATIDLASVDHPGISRGIYRFEGDQLTLCIGDPLTELRPASLTAPKGSRAMLLVLTRDQPGTVVIATTPDPAESPLPAPVPSDDELRRLLPGEWRVPDQLGWIHLRFRENGSFTSCRIHQELQLFRSVFVERPVSRGTWEVRNGQVLLTVFASTDPLRTGTRHCFTVTSLTPAEFIFVDGFGRTNTARREPRVNP